MNELNLNEKLSFIQTQLKVPKKQRNNFGKYNFRSAEDILEALKPLLQQEQSTVLLSDEMVELGNRIYVKSTASFCCGNDKLQVTAFAREPENKKGMDESQITGAASSYARKYALGGLFGIDDTKDADSFNRHDMTSNKKVVVNQAQAIGGVQTVPTLEQTKKVIFDAIRATPEQINEIIADCKKNGKLEITEEREKAMRDFAYKEELKQKGVM